MIWLPPCKRITGRWAAGGYYKFRFRNASDEFLLRNQIKQQVYSPHGQQQIISHNFLEPLAFAVEFLLPVQALLQARTQLRLRTPANTFCLPPASAEGEASTSRLLEVRTQMRHCFRKRRLEGGHLLNTLVPWPGQHIRRGGGRQ